MSELVRFWIEGGGEWLYTTNTSALVYNTKTYEPLAIENISAHTDLEKSIGSLEMPYAVNPAPLLRLPLWNSLKIETLTYPNGSHIFTGSVTGCRHMPAKGIAELKLSAGLGKLGGVTPRRTFGATCDYELYGTACGVNSSLFRDIIPSSEIAQTGISLTHATFATHANGWYVNGHLQNGAEWGLITYHSGTTIKLLQPLQLLGAVSNIQVFAGCNKSLDHCGPKFNNEAAFGGCPWITQKNYVVHGW